MRAALALLSLASCVDVSDSLPPDDAGSVQRPEPPSCSFHSERVDTRVTLEFTASCPTAGDLAVVVTALDHALVNGATLRELRCPMAGSLELTVLWDDGVYVDVWLVPTGATQRYACTRR